MADIVSAAAVVAEVLECGDGSGEAAGGAGEDIWCTPGDPFVWPSFSSSRPTVVSKSFIENYGEWPP
jgi:hypothetical protein